MVSISRFEAISHGKVIVGKPSVPVQRLEGCAPDDHLILQDCLISLEPESITRSFKPISVSLVCQRNETFNRIGFDGQGQIIALSQEHRNRQGIAFGSGIYQRRLN